MAEETRDPSGFRIAITSVAQGRNPGELLYSLETNEVSGIFAVGADSVERGYSIPPISACGILR